MISKGDRINTDFPLKIVSGGEEREVLFSDLLDRPTVVTVYMKNNTPSCDRQNESLAKEADWFNKNGYNLIAISKDGCRSHKNYSKKMGIRYILASDPEYRFAKAVDSIVEKKMFGLTFNAPSRSAYIIDTDGTVLDLIEKINTKSHADELKALIEN